LLVKVIGFTEPGGPEVMLAFDIAEAAVGPNQVRVRVLAAAVNPTDAVTRSHRPLHPMMPTWNLLSSPAGMQRESSTTPIRRRVTYPAMRSWRSNCP